MSHKIEFDQWHLYGMGSLISEQDAIDFVDLFFEGPPTRFIFVGTIEGKGDARGLHQSMFDGSHKICLSFKNIVSHFEKGWTMGGNRKHTDLKLAALSVLRHELQHANQGVKHKGEGGFSSFYKGKYKSRPCEMDARASADKDDVFIKAIKEDSFVPTEKKTNKSDLELMIELLVENLRGIDSITHDELHDELRELGINSPSAFSTTKKSLISYGVKVIR